MIRPLCIYHANCIDGFTAAWVVKQALSGNVEFFPANYGDAPPEVKGRKLYIVDFSYPLLVMQKLWEDSEQLILLDHHKTAIEEIKNIGHLPDAYDEAVLDKNRSGAGIAWDYFFPNMSRPAFLNAVEDRDLWLFKLPHSKEICAYIFTLEQTMAEWNLLANKHIAEIIATGTTLVTKQIKDVRQLVESGAREYYLAGHKTLTLNTVAMLTSDAGNYMMRNFDIPFAVCYWDGDKERHFSLRSLDEKQDVSVIAKLYGGGGHRNAAGFKVPFDHKLATNYLGDN